MIRNVLILGSGKMALNIGIRLLRAGMDVAWWSSSAERLVELEKRVSKTIRRLNRIGEATGLGQSLYLGREDSVVGSVDVILESTSEDLECKRAVVKTANRFRREHTILLSNSSSILPWDIDPSCIGVHFFYPVELHPAAEIIFSESVSEETKHRVFGFVARAGIEPLVENEYSAFAVNRLLLPLQNEAFRALGNGIPAEYVDECSASELFPNPILTYMDHVGIDVVLKAVEGYIGRMSSTERQSYAPLREGLREAVAVGVLGNKVKTSIRQLYRDGRMNYTIEGCSVLSERMTAVLLNSVLRFTEKGLIEHSRVNTIIEAVWGGKGLIGMLVQRDGISILERLQDGYHRTGFLYFEPAHVLRSLS